LGGVRVSRPEWGKKRSCLHCEARFYDLNRNSAECPTCGTVNNFAADIKPARATAPKAKEKAEEPAAPAEEEVLEETETDDDEDALDDDVDETLMEDTSDLGADDDVSEVMEHVESDGDDKG